jgi:hypothetical protein
MRKQHTRRRSALVMLIVLTVSGIPTPGSALGSDTNPADELAKAEREYRAERYADALARLRGLAAETDVPRELELAELVLEARCLVQLGRLEEAEKAFAAVLDLDDSWRPTSLFPPEEVAVFDAALAARDSGKKIWDYPVAIVVGAAAVVAGVLLLSVDGPDDDGTTTPAALDEPPPPPGGGR